MKTRQKILPAVCCISLLGACASNQTVSLAPLTIKAINPIAAIKTNSKPESFYQLGRYYQGQNRYELAIAAYQKALAADNGFVEARNGLGVIFSRQGQYKEAIAAFKLAIQQAPKAAHLYSNLGYAYYLQGQYADSVAALVQATSLDPNNQHALNNLGLVYAKAGNAVEAMQTFSQAATQLTVTQAATQASAVESPTFTAPVIGTTSVSGNITGNISSKTLTSEVASTSNASRLASLPESKPHESKPIESKPIESNSTEVLAVNIQSLTLPKELDAIRLAATALPVVESRTRLVPLKPHVSELQMQAYEPITQVVPQSSVPEALADNAGAAKLKLEVANGNGVAGMAGKVGQFLRSQGYAVPRLTNHKPFQVRMTQIQYRPGYLAQAQLLQASLPEAANLIKQNNMRADIGIRLLLGKDVVTRTAYFDGKTALPLVALN